jgi:GNAT superfamily N-acetyltransferase
MHAIQIRPLAQSDSLEDLTSMLHRSFSNLERNGMNCTCADQSTAETKQRARRGQCYVAVCDGRIVGTITLVQSDRRSVCHWYRRSDVASLHQFAVDPCFQGTGCGKALLLVATHWAHNRHYGELALNAPAPALGLIQFYVSQGFRVVEQVQLPGKTYDSSVLSKSIEPARSFHQPRNWAQPLRQVGLHSAHAGH